MAQWKNWAGNQAATGIEVVSPHSVEELATVVGDASAAGRRVRPVGTGHSFTPIAVPTEVQLRLDHLSGVACADTESGLVTALGGTPLARLNDALTTLGLAMTNLGDIEEQTVAGAISTGTHGTGLGFGGLATQVRALDLVLADGSRLSCSATENPDVFEHARVGLGALGIITAVTLQTEPAFALTAVEGGGDLAETMAGFEHDIVERDHLEFYWFPHTRRVLTKHHTRHRLDPDALAPLSRLRAWWDDEFLANTVLGAVTGTGRRLPSLVRPLAKLTGHALGPRTFTDLSPRVFTSPRRVRFEEMEYAVPREVGMEVLHEIVTVVERSPWRIAVPVEVRTAAADDIPLSTGYGRENVYIAVHTPPGAPDQAPYFAAVEEIARAAGGRPHWGKLHSLGAAELADRYPCFADFVALRDRLDPDRVFTNPYLDRVLG